MNDKDWEHVEEVMRSELIKNATELSGRYKMSKKEFVKYVQSLAYGNLLDLYLGKR